MAAIVAVLALVVVAAGIGLFVVVGGDDERDADSRGPSSTATPETGPSTGPSAPPSEGPTSESAPPTDTVAPPSSPSIPDSVPPGGTDSFVPPEEFPEPNGAGPSLTGGIEVPGTEDEAAAFYRDAMPTAGYEVADLEIPIGVTLTVSGNGVSGQLVFVDVGTGSTSVLWVATP